MKPCSRLFARFLCVLQSRQITGMITGLIIGAIALGDRAFACEGRSLQFEDKFETADPGWGETGPRLQIGGGSAVLSAVPNTPFWSWNLNYAFDLADICTEVALKRGKPTQETGMGLLFWVADNLNYYSYAIYGDGWVRVYRKVGGQWQPHLFTASAMPALEPGKGVKLRVLTQGDEALLYVNGEQIGAIKGEAPKAGGAVGMFVQTEAPNTEAAAEFRHFKVTSVP